MIKYKVKARLANNLGTDEFALEEFEKPFSLKEPILSRKKAFAYYRSIIDIIDEGEDDIDAIRSHIRKKGRNTSIKIGGRTINVPSNKENLGIGIYLISDIDDEIFEEGKEYLIIGYNESVNYLSIAHNLENEKIIYEKNNWDNQGWTADIKYYDYQVDEGDVYIIQPNVLWTPFDFWEHHNPSLADKDFAIETKPKVEESSVIHQIIKQGENRNVEFKSSLRFDIKKKQSQDHIEKSILKTISAFANTGGGTLLIGVADNGDILGLENDINTFKNRSKDKFAQHFDNLLKSSFTEPIDALLNYGFEEINSVDVFLVTVLASTKPRFLTYKGDGKEFYIRRAASSNALDIEKTYQYIIDKWHA